MRRVPTAGLKPGMKVGHPVYNSRGEVLINRDVTLNERYIKSLIKLGIPALYIIDESIPDFYVEDVIDEKSRMAAVKLTRDILEGAGRGVSPLKRALLDKARTTVSDIIDQLLENSSIMVNLIDIRCMDDYLFGHSVNVCVLSLITGISLGYSRNTLLNLGMGALMHDMGKTLIPPRFLNKPAPLTDEEFKVIKRHPEFGYTILVNNEPHIRKISALIALQHHERYNGTGYPKGLNGKDIHEFSQIVGIADVFDAMTHDRVYRRAHPPNEAYEMLAGSGNFFFSYKLVRAFLSCVAAYPAGSLVKLNSNETALVIDTPKGFPLYPRIKILFDAGGKRLPEPVDVDMLSNNLYTIVKVLDNQEIEELTLRDVSSQTIDVK